MIYELDKRNKLIDFIIFIDRQPLVITCEIFLDNGTPETLGIPVVIVYV
ncbi:protein of unknown function [Xenorhabdus poinarii G6]|uniref:Uncharacterized protein n=1 Tax=Xenorhabdus poinarii G6 TaxID=1354304 RepID=A0A068R0A7_9GAMM|nr:protein of unknown function [Xenorhabdus poinarii G6]